MGKWGWVLSWGQRDPVGQSLGWGLSFLISTTGVMTARPQALCGLLGDLSQHHGDLAVLWSAEQTGSHISVELRAGHLHLP